MSAADRARLTSKTVALDLTIHAVGASGAATTFCGSRPGRGLVLRTSEQAKFFADRPDRCDRCWSVHRARTTRAAPAVASAAPTKPPSKLTAKPAAKPKVKQNPWCTTTEIDLARAAMIESGWNMNAAVKLLTDVGMVLDRAVISVDYARRTRGPY